MCFELGAWKDGLVVNINHCSLSVKAFTDAFIYLNFHGCLFKKETITLSNFAERRGR